MALLNLKYSKTIPYRYKVIVLLCSLTTPTYLDRICISIVGVRVKSEFDLTNTQFGWVLAAFSLAYAVFEIPAGVWGDRIGPRAMFIRIVSWWSIFTILTGFTGGLISLIIIRFFKEVFRPPFEFKEIIRQCYEIGYKSLPLITLTGFITGLVFTKQSRPSCPGF